MPAWPRGWPRPPWPVLWWRRSAQGPDSASAHDGSPRQDAFAAARAATAQYHDITKATGFTELDDAAGIACIDNPAGGMGVHFVERLAAELGARPGAARGPGLRAAGRRVDEARGAGVRHPRLGLEGPRRAGAVRQSFEYQPGPGEANPNRFGLPAFWELHLWVWNENPRGIFDDWNPKVTCANG